jgi:arabinogalactan endo-1,4-beta-galactosidase
MNWTYQVNTLPAWMSNPLLSEIGVSAYYPLMEVPQSLAAAQVPALWRQKVQYYLDAISTRLHKDLLISEIGYRDTADALFQPGLETSKAPVDTMLQAAAFSAALMNAVQDKHIVGLFVWGWSVPTFQPNWRPAAQVINYWYGALDA